MANKAYRHEYYMKHKEHEKKRNKAYRLKNRERWLKYRAKWQRGDQKVKRAAIRELIGILKDVPCADCGKRYSRYVMDFDHVRGDKHFTIGRSQEHPDLEAVAEEIAKCDVVCANCHREREFQRRQDGNEKEYGEG